MTNFGIKALTATVAVLALGAPTQGWAMTRQAGMLGTANSLVVAQAADNSADASAADAAPVVTPVTWQGIGCVATAGAALTYTAFVAGAAETLMVAAGGLTVASSSPTLWLGLTSTMTAATCALGAAATPAVLWAVEQKDNIAANFAYQAKAVGSEVASFSNGVMASLFAAAPAAGEPRQLAERVDSGR
jgi:hypothetical protein